MVHGPLGGGNLEKRPDKGRRRRDKDQSPGKKEAVIIDPNGKVRPPKSLNVYKAQIKMEERW
jgi:hypothetical protein